MNENKENVIVLQTEVNDLKNQLQIIQDANKKRIEEFSIKLNSIKNEKLFLNDNISKLENKIKSIENEKEMFKKEYKNNENNNEKDNTIKQLTDQINSANKKLQKYNQMLEDANNWKSQINKQLTDIKDDLQKKLESFEEVEILLKNIKDIDINQLQNSNLENTELNFKVKDLSTQLNYLTQTKKNNEQRLLELNELINKDDLTIQETRNKLKKFRDSLVEDLIDK